MSWTAIVILAVGVYAMKAAGPVLFAGRSLPERWEGVATMVAVPLLAALVVTQTVTAGHHFVLDARLPALVVAAGAVALRFPFLVVVLLGGGTCALLRLLF